MRLICFARYALVACIVALLAMGIFSRRGWLDWQRMVRNNDQMRAKLEQTKLEKAHWETRLGGLKSNRRAQERTVRQYLGFVKKDEIVIEF